ncbi:MAG TPA: DUF3048 domain-containing protein [Candidatus Dormibacteraeota bacterium]|nr:DUF3048 domain-containing protein [Candidatus Dormibacteraeota bacterium]
MRQTGAQRSGLAMTLRRRWWVLPIILLLVAAGLALRALTAPLAVNASVSDGDHAVVRSSTVLLTFNQDMDVDSVLKGIRISPLTPFDVTVGSARRFEVKPWLQPDTSYRITITGARKAMGFGSETYTVGFHTEPAPKVTAATLNDAPLAAGQQAVPLRGNLKISFSQPMDAAQTPLLLDGARLDSKTITWDKAGQTATVPLTLSHSRTHTLLVPKTAANQKHDLAIDDWTLSFTTMVQVPSAGSTARIGNSGAPIIIQIENSTQPTVRPQTGMQQADMIYEYISEFGIPRLTAIYWHPPTAMIAPVRSCRLITVQLEQMYRGMIYCSGANDFVLGQVWKWPNVVYDYAYMYSWMYRTGDRVAPHNVQARPDQITAHTASANLPALNYDIAPAHPDAALPGAVPATSVTIPQHNAVWRYDANMHEYLKWEDGAPFTNVGTGQVHAKNLIIEHVTSFLDTNPANVGVHRNYNTEYYELAGEGTADIYTDGGMIHATWKHPNRDLPVVYYDASGNPVDLNTGLTWVHVIGSDQ